MTGGWHPHLRELFRLSDRSTCFPLAIRTSVPIAPWQSSTVTLIGDAIHTMTPGRGVGANTALRDAQLLCARLTDARDDRGSLVAAIHAYESRMIAYAFDAVVKSRQQMDGDALMHKPVVGRLALAGMRTGMRLVNHIPPLKQRMADNLSRDRGADRAA
jgi:2-polyprenyl-6-methoxyphenol hydroxylase-like FAD-dependent oxidoreductase